jgi:hypothetical protein
MKRNQEKKYKRLLLSLFIFLLILLPYQILHFISQLIRWLER